VSFCCAPLLSPTRIVFLCLFVWFSFSAWFPFIIPFIFDLLQEIGGICLLGIIGLDWAKTETELDHFTHTHTHASPGYGFIATVNAASGMDGWDGMDKLALTGLHNSSFLCRYDETRRIHETQTHRGRFVY